MSTEQLGNDEGRANTGSFTYGIPPSNLRVGVELGITGLTQFSGYLNEEKLIQLRSTREAAVYREMQDNDATIGAILFAVEKLCQSVDWWWEPVDDTPEALDYAEFMEECQNDMSHSWTSTVAEILSMLTFGWATLELCYKYRRGPNQTDAIYRSKYNDGKVGWRKLPIRAQETCLHWVFDRDGGIQGWVQLPPMGGPMIDLPIEKLLLFRTTSRKNNPQGRSVLRNSYVPWYRKKNMERIESVGMERTLIGFPVLYLPPQLMDPNASAGEKKEFAEYQKIMRNLRSDEQQSLILPSIYDKEGHQLVKFDLAKGEMQRAPVTDIIIQRYARDMLTAVLADILILGQQAVGSYALSSSKTFLFAVAIGTFLDEISSVFNSHGVTRLWKINDFPPEKMPKLVHGDLEKEDMGPVAQAVFQLVQAGFLTAGHPNDENHFRKALGMGDLQNPEDHLDWHTQDDTNKNNSQRLAAEQRAYQDGQQGLPFKPTPGVTNNPPPGAGASPKQMMQAEALKVLYKTLSGFKPGRIRPVRQR